MIQIGKLKRVHAAAKPAAESLSLVSSLLKNDVSLNPVLSEILLEDRPVSVIKSGSDFDVISGFREWHLARQRYERTESILVSVRANLTNANIQKMAWADVYGRAILYSLHPKKMPIQLADLLSQIPTSIRNEVFDGLQNKMQLGKATGLSRSSFYTAASPDEADFSFEAIFKK